jgi:hypothetical protein
VFQLDDWVLCRIHKKSNNFQISDQEGLTVEEESLNNNLNNSTSAASPKSDANDDDGDQLQFQATTTTMTSMGKSYSSTDHKDSQNPLRHSGGEAFARNTLRNATAATSRPTSRLQRNNTRELSQRDHTALRTDAHTHGAESASIN